MINVYSLLSDVILIAHFAFIAFVIGGQVCVLIGYFRKWVWVRNFTFRVCHILAIGAVVILAWADNICPLTVLENTFREASGNPSYSGTFVEHWLSKVIYYDAPQWIFALTYSIFGALVLLSWNWVRPTNRRMSKNAVEGTA